MVRPLVIGGIDLFELELLLTLERLLLQLGEEGLVLLVQELRLLPEPLVLLHHVAVLQVQI